MRCDDFMEFNADTFKALGSKTRLSLIKHLGQRRMTLSELSKCTGLHVSSVKEHLDVLTNAGLVERSDEGQKWKYYSLTPSVKRTFSNSFEISLVLPLSILFMVSGAVHFMYVSMVPKFGGLMQSSEGLATKMIPEMTDAVMDSGVSEMPVVLNTVCSAYSGLSFVSIGLVLIGILLFGIFIGLKFRENRFC